MKVKGLPALLKFSKSLRDLPQATRRTEEAIMRDWTERARKGFDSESDPYGKRWARRKTPSAQPVLTGPTRRLRKITLVRLTSNRWKMKTQGGGYLPFHQRGTSRMPRRRVFPDEGRLPRSWREAGRKIYRQRMKEHFGR